MQDPTLVFAIFDYRNAKTAIELMNRGEEGAKALGESPVLLPTLEKLRRAQQAAERKDT